MEIQCPSCQKKLAIGDQFAGQLIKCPACNGVFMAPTLVKPVNVPPPMVPTVMEASPATMPNAVPPPVAPPVPAPMASPPLVAPTVAMKAPDVIPFTEPPPLPPPAPSYAPPPPPPPKPPKPVYVEEEPAGPPGEFTKTRTCSLQPHVLRWVAPICLSLDVLFSFAGWKLKAVTEGESTNLWSLAFGDHSEPAYTFYLILTFFFALPLAWVKLLMEKNVIPLPEAIRPYWKWRSIVALAVAALPILWPLWHLVDANLLAVFNAFLLGMKLAIRLHLIAIVAYALEIWLERRKKTNLPLPEMTVRW